MKEKGITLMFIVLILRCSLYSQIKKSNRKSNLTCSDIKQFTSKILHNESLPNLKEETTSNENKSFLEVTAENSIKELYLNSTDYFSRDLLILSAYLICITSLFFWLLVFTWVHNKKDLSDASVSIINSLEQILGHRNYSEVVKL